MNTPNTPVSECNSAVTPLLLSFQLPALGVQTDLPFAIKLSDFKSGVFCILSDLIEGFCDGLVERGLICSDPRGEDGRHIHRQQLDRFADDVSKMSQSLAQSSFLAHGHGHVVVDEGRTESFKPRKPKLITQDGQSSRQKLEFQHIDPVEVLKQYSIPVMNDDDIDFRPPSLGSRAMDSPKKYYGAADGQYLGRRVPRALPAKYISLEGGVCSTDNFSIALSEKARPVFRPNRELLERRLAGEQVDERLTEEKGGCEERPSDERPSTLRLELPQPADDQAEAHRRNEFRTDRSDRSLERSPRRKDVSLPEDTSALRVPKTSQAAGPPASSVSLQAAHRSVKLSRTVLEQKPDAVLPLVYVSRDLVKPSFVVGGAAAAPDAEPASTLAIAAAPTVALDTAKQHKPSEGESSPRRGRHRDVSPLRDLGLNKFSSELVGRTFADFQKASAMSQSRDPKTDARSPRREPVGHGDCSLRELVPAAEFPVTTPGQQHFRSWNVSKELPKVKDASLNAESAAAGKDFLPVLATAAPPVRQHKAARFRICHGSKARKQQDLPALTSSGSVKELKVAAGGST